jgi:hypothetical protein
MDRWAKVCRILGVFLSDLLSAEFEPVVASLVLADTVFAEEVRAAFEVHLVGTEMEGSGCEAAFLEGPAALGEDFAVQMDVVCCAVDAVYG